MHGLMEIQKYTNSKDKYLNKAFNKSNNLNNGFNIRKDYIYIIIEKN